MNTFMDINEERI